jgi:hypothetical protein
MTNTLPASSAEAVLILAENALFVLDFSQSFPVGVIVAVGHERADVPVGTEVFEHAHSAITATIKTNIFFINLSVV